MLELEKLGKRRKNVQKNFRSRCHISYREAYMLKWVVTYFQKNKRLFRLLSSPRKSNIDLPYIMYQTVVNVYIIARYAFYVIAFLKNLQ